MKIRAKLCAVLALAPVAGIAAGAGAYESSPETGAGEMPVQITVRGRTPDVGTAEAGRVPEDFLDSARLLRRLPGADVQSNGTISGRVQYRGLSGPRMNVVVDGMHIDPGGPNWMDPPLHYAPPLLLERIELSRGIAPVRSGAETLGGTVRAQTRRSVFAEGRAFETHADLALSARSAHRSGSGAGFVSLANRHHRLHALASVESGEDLEFPGGKVRATGYERTTAGGGYGLKRGGHEFSLEYRHSRTGETGTPALPLDIRFFDSRLASVEYGGSWGELRLGGRAHYSDIDHRMDNFNLRPAPPDPGKARLIDARSRGLGFAAHAALARWGGELELGADGKISEHEMQVFNPNLPGFFALPFNDATRNLHGVYAEWRGALSGNWSAEFGARRNRVKMSAGRASLAGGLPAPLQGLKHAFNAGDRDRVDANYDWVAKLRFQASPRLQLELGTARKTRSPHYIERFAWLPIEATAGLADGNNHVGDVALEPEVSHEIEIGLDWRGRRLFLAPRAFFRRVDDYIQGIPVDATPGAVDSPLEAVSRLNGDPSPLRYANVDAELFGADLAWGVSLGAGVSLDGSLSWVRGRRRDAGDDLYRLAPLGGRVSLRFERSNWNLALESVFTARQDHVSAANGERETAGWAVFHLRCAIDRGSGLRLSGGVLNLLDKRYREHLGGYNRVRNSDVLPGDRLPGPGRSLAVRVGYAF